MHLLATDIVGKDGNILIEMYEQLDKVISEIKNIIDERKNW